MRPPSLVQPPSEEDTRRQLEGAVEVVEAARARYTALERCLSGRRWKRGLRARPELLRGVPPLEPDVEEARSRIQRRAESEQWPPGASVLVLLRETLARRGRLEQRIRARLGEDAATAEAASTLLERLPTLEALAFQPDPRRLAPGEVLLLEGKAEEQRGRVETWAVRILWCALFGYSLGVGWLAKNSWGLLVPLGLVLVDRFLAWLRRGHYRLTRERLLWLPLHGEAFQFPLSTLTREDFEFGSPTARVHVKGRHERITLRLLDDEAVHRLQLVLELHRHSLPRDAVSDRTPSELVCFPATLEAGTIREGHAVLRPGAMAFVPGQGLVAWMQSFLGAESSFTPRPGDLPLVLDQLRHLRADIFDEVLERAVRAVGGEWWRAENVARQPPRMPVHQYLHVKLLEGPTKSVRGRVDKREHEVAERILAAWPRR